MQAQGAPDQESDGHHPHHPHVLHTLAVKASYPGTDLDVTDPAVTKSKPSERF